MQDEKFLKDIEQDIDGDWEKIKTKLEEEEWQKKHEEPKRFHFPSFKKFHSHLLELYREVRFGGESSSFSTSELLYRIFRKQHGIESMPNSFEKVWGIYCDPDRYRCEKNLKCNGCQKYWDVFYEEKVIHASLWDRDRIREEKVYLYQPIDVCCPICGYDMLRMPHKLVGIFECKEEEELSRNHDDLFLSEIDDLM